MPQQAPLRLIKRCRLYERRGNWKPIPPVTRGFYVLYREGSVGTGGKPIFEVAYIGVGGLIPSRGPGFSLSQFRLIPQFLL